jgi:hypothetical protein
MPDKPLRVFLSHRVEEHGHAVESFAKALELITDKDKLQIFRSTKIPAGDKWSAEIHKQLREADVLIFFCLSTLTTSDWCIYETGFFAAIAQGQHGNRKLICVVPKGESPPSPLAEWQLIELTEKGMKELLRSLLATGDEPIKPELFSEEHIDDLNETIAKILTVLGPGEKVRPLSHRVWITLPPSPLDKAAGSITDTLRSGEIPQGTVLGGESEAFREFGLRAKQRISYADFVKGVEFPHALPFFTPILAKAMGDILARKVGPFPLPPVRVFKSGDARTLVFANLIEKPSGHITFEFIVAQPPAVSPTSETESFSTLHDLLATSIHFRREVIAQHERRLRNAVHDDDGSDEFRQRAREMLRAMIFDINVGMLNSLNHGLISRGQLISAFEPGSTEFDLVSSMIDARDGAWVKVYSRLNESVVEGDLQKASIGMEEMKSINKAIIGIAAKRLAELSMDLSGETLAVVDA